MKKVIKKTRPAHVLGGRQASPEKRAGVFIESIMVNSFMAPPRESREFAVGPRCLPREKREFHYGDQRAPLIHL